MVARALGSGPDARYALRIDGDAVREEAAPGEAALLVVTGRRAKP
jgi:hypothetical protein